MNHDGTISWAALFDEASARLAAVSADPRIDARRILEQVGGIEPAQFSSTLDELVTTRQMVAYDRMIERRLTGEPLQYVVGSWSFRLLDLYLDRRVLIPRPETEIVTEHALAEHDRSVQARGAREGVVVDLGTGSGAIALSVAVERRGTQVWATDVSADALAVAQANCAGLGRVARHVTLVHGNWFDPLPESLRGVVDVIVSNPPYVAADDELPAEVRDWEPVEALVPGPRGLEAYESIVVHAPEWLAVTGALVLEIGAAQRAAVRELVLDSGFASAEVHADLAGRDRVVVARR
ncbi:MAG TPA: peptide chain release factor N(5)-glutamine methyltransferase [Acidimicrobiales bacterium]|nr:peptide chain release factor N(5)-glutamine methyltransferase [Acidimicrobiales bacterium]